MMLLDNKLHAVLCFVLMQVLCTQACIKLLNGEWKRISLEERTKRAPLVVTGKILYTEKVPGHDIFYSATFEVLNVLKGWNLLKQLHKMNSTSVKALEPKIIATAVGFANYDCFSTVEEDESYALFLSYNSEKDTIVARYDDIFGAADRLYQRTERAILATLGK